MWGRIQAPQRCPHPNLRTYEYVRLHGKREWRLPTTWSWDGKIILDYLGRSNVITKVLISTIGKQESESQGRRRDTGRRVIMVQDENDSIRDVWLWKCTKGPWAKECRWPLEAGKGEEMNSVLAPPKECNPAEILILAISDFRPTEL